MLQPVRQIGLARSGFQHDMPLRQRIDAVGERRAPSRSTARPATPRCRARAAARPPPARDPPAPATGRPRARPASAVAAAAPGPAPPPASAAGRRTARRRARGASRRSRGRWPAPPRRARRARRAAGRRPPAAGCRCTLSCVNTRWPSITCDKPGARRLARAGAGEVAAVETHAAAIHGSSPDTARSSVVLPAPFGPSSATTSPARDRRSTPCSTPILP